jgi:DnaJ-class molecular chaperone
MSDALYDECAKCEGSGQYAPPRIDRGGGGWTQESPGDCPVCKGAGAIPTPEGLRILKLVQRFSRYGGLRLP